MTRTKAGR